MIDAGYRVAGRYRLERCVGAGELSEVWAAEDTRLGRGVAVKVLPDWLSSDPGFVHRFRIDAGAQAALDHPGIVAVFDYGVEDGPHDWRTAFLVTELVRGESLTSLLTHGPFDSDRTLSIMEQAARALQAAHERGYVHRDVHPGNILARIDGTVTLTDFGITDAANKVHETRVLRDRFGYLAPEQLSVARLLSGAEVTPATDVYSLGIVGYACLAGQRPFRAADPITVEGMQLLVERQLYADPPPLPDTVPLAVRALLETVLAKDPTLRYANGGELASAVATVRRGDPPPAPRAHNAGWSRDPWPSETSTPVRGVFICYRTADTGAAAGRLAERLIDRIGEERVFIDVESVEVGTDYRDAVRAAIERTAVMLVVIGDRWLGSGRFGRSRIHDPRDAVRLEIEHALRIGVRIVPVLVDASIPRPDQLPASLRPLSTLNSVPLGVRTWRRDAPVVLDEVTRLLAR